MKAWLSPFSASALLNHPEGFILCGRDGPLEQLSPSRARSWLAAHGELTECEITNVEDVRGLLVRHCDQQEALDMALISLDGSLAKDLRLRALNAMSRLLLNKEVRLWLTDLFSIRPFVETADSNAALSLAHASGLVSYCEWLQPLLDRQSSVAQLWKNWNSLPNHLSYDEAQAHALLQILLGSGIVTKISEGLAHADTDIAQLEVVQILEALGVNDALRISKILGDSGSGKEFNSSNLAITFTKDEADKKNDQARPVANRQEVLLASEGLAGELSRAAAGNKGTGSAIDSKIGGPPQSGRDHPTNGADNQIKVDYSWFVSAVLKFRKTFGAVLLISFLLQLIGLVSPLFIQELIDKMLADKGMATLEILVVGLVAVVIFESVLYLLRAHVFRHITGRITVQLGVDLFRHIVELPFAYFQTRRMADSAARVRELENVRSFLTGNALTVLLDVVFSIVFIAVMLLYSVQLTMIVLASLPLYFGLSLVVVPKMRDRLNVKFAQDTENQALFVETINGIQTVKAKAREAESCKRWDDRWGAYVSANIKTQYLADLVREGFNLIGKLVNAATLWYGAQLVISNELSFGQFIAFNLFAQRVTQPIMQMAQMWTDFQQTGVSVARLSDIFDTRTEATANGTGRLHFVRGQITLDNLTFRYGTRGVPVLNEISLDVTPGEIVGIVGRSGSGKSTLVKLLQRLYSPESGRMLFDGIDINLIDPQHLRRQVGVVLHDNLLFHGSVRENITIADPTTPFDNVVHVAQLAGAHEFIIQLPEGYDTQISNESGGLSASQRQRIAIARELVTNPRILILDEATSALDYESEAIHRKTMAHICRGRTVLIVEQRLRSVRHANRILVMDRGKIIENGSHESLVLKPNGMYAKMWRMQAQGRPTTGGIQGANDAAATKI